MEAAPLVSIITSVYNTEDYLPRCIESIIHQDLKEWELLLIDDGSTDRSGSICDAYAAQDARIQVIHKENTGLADSRNLGIRLAKADLIGFVDADDWIEPDMYKVLYHQLKDTQADIAVGGLFYDYKNQSLPTLVSEEVNEYSHDEALLLVLEDKLIRSYLCDKLFCKSVLVEPLPKHRYYEDYATLFKWFHHATKVVIYQKSFYHYRQRRGSIEHTASSKKKYHFFLAEWDRFEYLTEQAVFPERKDVYAQKVLKETHDMAKYIALCAESWQTKRLYLGWMHEKLRSFHPLPLDMKPKIRRRLRWLQRSALFYLLVMQATHWHVFKKQKPNEVHEFYD